MNLKDWGNSEQLGDTQGVCLTRDFTSSNHWREEALGTDGSYTGCAGEFQSFPDL